jgi:hypothetical protein
LQNDRPLAPYVFKRDGNTFFRVTPHLISIQIVHIVQL